MRIGSAYRHDVGVIEHRWNGFGVSRFVRTHRIGHKVSVGFWSIVATIDIFVIGSILLAMIGFDGGVQLIIDTAYSVL